MEMLHQITLFGVKFLRIYSLKQLRELDILSPWNNQTS